MQSVRCAKRVAVLAENDEEEEEEASDWGRDGERRTREVSRGATTCWDSRGGWRGPEDKDGGGWGGGEAAVRRPPGCYNTSSLRGGERLVLPSAQAHEWGCCWKALSPLSARRHGVEQGAPFMHSH